MQIISCSEKTNEVDYSDFSEKSVTIIGLNEQHRLIDTLATISLNIPKRLDTFYRWQNTSDCLICGWCQYRFADSRYEVFAESGFLWNTAPDSTYQITIRHKPLSWLKKDQRLHAISEKDSDLLNDIGNWSSLENVVLLKKELIQINSRNFYTYQIKSAQGFITDKPSYYYIGITYLKDRHLQVIAEHSGKDTVEFYKIMHKTLMSVKIEEKL